MALYETTFIARQDISQQDVNKLSEAFTNIINKNGGKVVKNEYWGLRNLAYRINKNKKGHYVLLAINAPSPAVKEMERNISLNEDIIRHLTVKVEEIEEGPSAIMQNNKDDSVDFPEFENDNMSF